MGQNKQRGAAAVIIVVVVLVLLAVVGGVVGYAVLKRVGKETNQSSTSETKSTTPAKTTDDAADAEAAADAHFKLLHEKKIDDAYNLTCASFKENQSLTSFRSDIESNSIFTTVDLTQVNFTKKDISNGQAVLSGAVGPLAPDLTLEVLLVKNNDQWCVHGYSTQ